MLIGVLDTVATPKRGKRLLHCLAEGAERNGHTAEHYNGRGVLALYGLGGPDRLPVAQKHDGDYLAWDAGYWNRKSENRSFRITINGLHPPQYVMRGESPGPDRWDASGLKIEQRGNPEGPIILVGNAPKSLRIGAAGWAAKKLAEIRQRFPGRRVLYRPKPKRPLEPVKADGVANGDIDDVLSCASLVVCRHSNVAVDACRLGIPVACDDGAASAIYPTLADWERQPDEATRAEFLHRLAYWQWTMEELGEEQFWTWLQTVI